MTDAEKAALDVALIDLRNGVIPETCATAEALRDVLAERSAQVEWKEQTDRLASKLRIGSPDVVDWFEVAAIAYDLGARVKDGE